MKIILYILLLTIIILETTLIAFPFSLIFILLVSIYLPAEVIIMAFLAGLLLDIFSLRHLGGSSLFFLVFTWIGGRYQKKLYPGNPFFRILFINSAVIFYIFLFYKNINIEKIVAFALTVTLLILFVDRIFPKTSGKMRLSIWEQ